MVRGAPESSPRRDHAEPSSSAIGIEERETMEKYLEARVEMKPDGF